MKKEHQEYLEQYLSKLNIEERASIPATIAEYFCADEYNANECARLINTNIKRASCTLKSAYDVDNEPLPEVGQLTVVLDWNEQPVCIVKLTSVSLCPFNEVTAEFAALEGEGDGTYEWWYKAHVKFFTKYAQNIEVTFDESSLLVLEQFTKVYPAE